MPILQVASAMSVSLEKSPLQLSPIRFEKSELQLSAVDSDKHVVKFISIKSSLILRVDHVRGLQLVN